MGVVIRRAAGADVDPLARLQLRTVLTAYAHIFPPEAPAPTLELLADSWRDVLARPGACAFVAEDGNGHGEETVGGVACFPDPEDPAAGHVAKLHVDLDRWSAGLGTQLLEVATAELAGRGHERATLWVLERNTRARALYERHGWDLVPGRTRGWPDLGVVEVAYARPLTPPRRGTSPSP